MDAPIKTKMTANEFMALADHDTGSVELIEGEVVVAGGAPDAHQELILNLVLLFTALGLKNHGRLRFAPLSVKLDDVNTFEPDIFWLAQDNPATIESARVIGAPDLVIEILSPSTGSIDKTTKYEVYERNGVKEYWIADPTHRTLDVFTLHDGKYERHGVYTEGDTFTSPVLGQTVTLSGVFQPTQSQFS